MRAAFIPGITLLTLLASAFAEAPSQPIEVEGLLIPYREVRIASRAQGVIDNIKREGESVKKGEAVMQLENTVEKLQVELQKHVLEMREFEAQQSATLRERNVVSETEVREKRIAKDIATVQLQQAEEMLERRNVRAPFDGKITERMRDVGEAVDEFVPVLTMVDLSRLYFEAYLPASRMNDIEVGQPALVEIPGHDKPYEGVVELKSPVVNPASREFKIRIVIPNPDGALSAGVGAKARIDSTEALTNTSQPQDSTADSPR